MPLLWQQRNAQKRHSLRFLSLTRLIEDFRGTVFPSSYKLGDQVCIRKEMLELKKKNNRNISAIAHVSLTMLPQVLFGNEWLISEIFHVL